MKTYYAFVTTEDATGKLVHDAGWEATSYWTTHDNRPCLGFNIPDNSPNGWAATLTLYSPGKVTISQRGILWTEISGVSKVIFDTDDYNFQGAYSFRRGLVRSVGRSYADDGGQFYPFGATLFWAIRGWKDEQDRIIQHFEYLRDNGYDYFRGLGDVDWPNGWSVDSSWPGYQSYVADMVDLAYDKYGLRFQPTIWGKGRNPIRSTMAKLLEVLQDRQEKVIAWEIANESYNLGPDISILKDLGRQLRQSTLNLVALSAPIGSEFEEMQNALSNGLNGNLLTAHLDRGYGDDDWEFVRQVWDCRDLHFATSNNEGKGPLSSVSSTFDPLRLSVFRLLGVMCGAGMHILHNGAGVYGAINGNRPANLWETPNIANITNAVSDITKLLPAGIEGWTRSSYGWVSPNPVSPVNSVNIYPAFTGPYRHYTASNGSKFVGIPHGINDNAELIANKHVRFTVYDLPDLTPLGDYELMPNARVKIKILHPNRDNALFILGDII